ncbi:cell division ATP-binding protein FtsE, partial [Cryobacterium glaciale]
TGPVAPAPAASPAAAPAASPIEAAPATPVPPMTRPVLPVAANDDPEQLTLAEKLGLRAPGEKPDQTGEQNVGPTR